MTEATMTEQAPAASKPGIGSKVADAVVRRMMGVSKRSGKYRVEKGIRVPTRDGFHLLTDHYIPEGAGPAATLLIRGPYGRAFPTSTTYGAVFAGAGYHVVIQSIRGTFGSTGGPMPFVKEAEDGQDTVAWLRSQSWFDQRLASIGGSYLGLTQWALLEDPPPELRASVIVVGPHDFGHAMYSTGAFALSMGFGWSEAMANQEVGGRLKGMTRMMSAGRKPEPGLDGLPLVEAAEPVLEGRAPWYRDWLVHEDVNDPFWDPYRHRDALQKTNVPTLLVGGWQDIFLDQTLEQYATLSGRGLEVGLTIGPWAHLDTVAKASGIIWRESLDWLDEHVGGQSSTGRAKPVRVFVTGAGEWRDYDRWPVATSDHVYYLNDQAALGESAGAGSSTFTFDPADPTPAVGGPLLHPRHAGVKDNKELEARADVLTFTSQPAGNDIDIIGIPTVELAMSVDNPHADVFVRLCDVDPKGTSRNFSDGLLKLDPKVPANQVQHVTVRLSACAHRLVTGHRLRALVSGGAHPRYVRNFGTGEPLATGKRLVPSVHMVQHEGSRVVLPVEAAAGA
jgi:putative CocE/NonD family hydrolase